MKKKNIMVVEDEKIVARNLAKHLPEPEYALEESGTSEEKLRLQEMQLHTILESTGDGILAVDNAGRVIKTNRRFADIWKIPSDLVEKGSDEALLTHVLGQLVDPDAFREKVHELYASTAVDFDTIVFKDGRIIERYSCPLLNEGVVNGRVWSFRDITERRRAEEALQKKNLDLLAIIDNLPFLAWLKDSEGRFIAVNVPFARSCGFPSANDLVGKTDLDIWPKHLAEAYRADDSEVMRTRQKKAVEESIADRGVEKWFETYKAPLYDTKGNVAGTTGFSRDITDRKQAEQKLIDTLGSLRRAVGTTIQVMVSAVETRDPYTAGHQIRSADLARAIASEMRLPQDKVDGIRMAGSIHDIGKLSIPAEILSKPVKLSEIEFSLIKEHARRGYEILKKVESTWPLADIVHQHHERMDGSGYPRNLKADDILIEARVLAVADVVEAMASYRPYRPAVGLNAALDEIEKNKGTLYDDAVVAACLRLFREKGFQLA